MDTVTHWEYDTVPDSFVHSEEAKTYVTLARPP